MKETDVVLEKGTAKAIYKDPDFGPRQIPWSKQVPPIATSKDLSKYPGGYMIAPPIANPLEVYNQRSSAFPFQQKEMNEKHAQLPPNGQEEDRDHSLDLMKSFYKTQRDEFIGYQCIEQFEISNDISPFLNMSLNNIGDPFQNGYFTVNAKQAERGVLDFFASVWHAQWPSLPKPERAENISDKEYLNSLAYQRFKESYWGYVLSMGSTEGNLYAVLSGRDYLSGYSLVVDDQKEESLCLPYHILEDDPNKYTPVAFYSEAAHYSLAKAVHAMQVKTFAQIAQEHPEWKCPLGTEKWPESVPVLQNGEVNIKDLLTLVEFFAAKGYPPFICFNYGTTFKGAYDNIPEICRLLKPIFKKYGLDQRKVDYFDAEGNLRTDYRRGYWIHVDGALGASLMPFVEMAVEHNNLPESDLAPCFDFRNEEVMSIVTSGHKWPSASAPTGVYMTKNKYLITPVATPDYLGSADTTFAGSRNGLSAMVLWNLIAKEGIQGLVKRSEHTMNLCAYAEKRFKELQKKLGDFDIWMQRAPQGGTSIIFRKPIDEIMFRYSLPIEEEYEIIDDESKCRKSYVHLFVFWDRTKEMIDNLIHDLQSEDAFDPESYQCMPRTKVRRELARQASHKLLKRSVHKGFKS